MKENENNELSSMAGADDYQRLSEKEISDVWDSMPGQPNGFYKSFGYSQFAHAIEDKVASRFRAQGGNTNTEIIGSAVSTAVGEPVATAEQPAIGKLLDEFSALPVLWGLNEPGALMRHSDVFKMLIAAGKTYLAAPTQVSSPTEELKQLRNRVSQLEAARIGYASEFPLTADGEPDVGNIHANIRALKAQVSAPQADDRWKLDAEKLADGIHDAAVKCGLLGFGTSITGPQCLMLLDTLAEMAKGAPQASAPQEVRAVPEDVRRALDRMCTPLDESRLSGVTAAADARCMQIIRRYVEGTSTAPAAMDEKGGAK